MSGFTPAQIAYMEANINDTKVPGLVAAIVICCSVATIAMVLRIVAKASTKNGYGMDDVFAFFGWIGNLGYTIAAGVSVKFGMGRHIIIVTDPRALIISVTVAECFFNFTVMFIKLSILTFYARIFPQRGFHMLIWVVSVVAVLQNVPAIFLTIFQCVPISAQWDPLVKATATCINYHAVTIAFGVLNIVTDLLILAMPVPLVWNLQVGRKKKLLICAAFAVGALACIIDIVRLAYSSALDSADTTWTFIPALITTSVELAVGLLCACVPLYRPLLARIFKNLDSPTKYSTNKSNSHTLKSIGTKRTENKGWDTISDDTAYLQEERGEAGGIRIQRDYSVSSSHS